MRLLHTRHLELHEFVGSDVPPYAILSHRWGNDEVTLQDILAGQELDSIGYNKIVGFCKVAAAAGFDHVWVDTCCIDKSSSAELSEAINSMYKWYENSAVCYAYLVDVDIAKFKSLFGMKTFSQSQWHRRGWTLQELIAPRHVIFLDARWNEIGTRMSLCEEIEHTTGISQKHLRGFRTKASVAERMSWASQRSTTREEDLAYCLLGIFGVSMPLLYGEGSNAFLRLQLEIIKFDDDESIFAWNERTFGRDSDFEGLLASGPHDFRHGATYMPYAFDNDREPFEITNQGLRTRALILPHKPRKNGAQRFTMPLNCVETHTLGDASQVGMLLERKIAENGRSYFISKGLTITLPSETVKEDVHREVVVVKQPGLSVEPARTARITAPLLECEDKQIRSIGFSLLLIWDDELGTTRIYARDLPDSSIEIFVVVVTIAEAMWPAAPGSKTHHPISNYCVRTLVPKQVRKPLPPPTVWHQVIAAYKVETPSTQATDRMSTRLRKSGTILSIAVRTVMRNQHAISKLYVEHDLHGECPWVRGDEAFDLPLTDDTAEERPGTRFELPLIQVSPPTAEREMNAIVEESRRS